ncbi:MAG TPA: hypothetical protein VGB52_06375 [Actinomycetota bacterium]
MRLRSIFTAALTGALLIGSVWAGTGLTPVGVDDATSAARDALARAGTISSAEVGEGEELGLDEALVGAAKVDIEPRPDDFGATWVRDTAACTPLTSGDAQGSLDHAADPRVTWIENNNCIYMGGFGLGPSQPVLEWDSYDPEIPVLNPDTGDFNELGYGLWARTVAVSRGGQTVILTILDGEGYFGEYSRMCGSTPCGAFDLAQQIATEVGADHPDLGISTDSFVLASTHAHSAMDFIGGWGGVPQWYMDQVAASIVESARVAVETMEPATVEAGDTLARGHNGERRDTYRSAEDPSVNWFRAVNRDGDTISTVGTYAAHATSFGSSATRAHADWPGVWDKRVEERFGGVGVMFEAGLGNMSTRGGWRIGARLGNLIPDVGEGTLVRTPDVRVARAYWDQPVTNGPLAALGGGGFFDRPFGGPGAVDVGTADVSRCRSASAISVRVSVTAARIGDVIVSAAPGEIFANYSNTIEERGSITSLAIGQANDALGYMPQSFESDHKARQGGGFVGAETFEYEDAYSIDGCFGDMALETTLSLLENL